MRLTRRSVILTGLLTGGMRRCPLDRFGFRISAARRQAQPREWRHGLSLFGELKYPPGFKHFEYVNPNAPKGGAVRLIAFGTFDNFNKAVSGVKGSIAAGAGLLTRPADGSALDEVSTEYGLIAEAVSHPPDFASATFRLRAEASRHDGKPITRRGRDLLAWSRSRSTARMLAAYYRHVMKMEQTGEREVTFTFDEPGNREMPLIVGQLSVLPKHWWEGTDSSGRKRDIGATTLEPPLGSGAYRIKEFVAGRTVVYERVKDYWGKDLNVNIGRDNFDELRFEYFRDSTVALEAFKADHCGLAQRKQRQELGDGLRFSRGEGQACRPRGIPRAQPGHHAGFRLQQPAREVQGSAACAARSTIAYDFEEMNKQIFFGQYKRISSYFHGTELACVGLAGRPGAPDPGQACATRCRRKYSPRPIPIRSAAIPRRSAPICARHCASCGRRATRFATRSWCNAKTGEPLTVEFLTQEPSLERIILFYKPSLERLGVTVSVRTVDDPQYENRLRNWDFDMIDRVLGAIAVARQRAARFLELAGRRSRRARAIYVGIKNPAIDALIERVIFAKDRAELVAATKALDRVLLWNHYVVPQWTYDKSRTARWDRFGQPRSAAEIRGLRRFRRCGGGTPSGRPRREPASDRVARM